MSDSRRGWSIGWAGAIVFAAACGGTPPQPPSVPPDSGVETVTGAERIGWSQAAADNAELATIHYVVYVDGVRTDLTGTACGPTAGTSGFACTAPLPPMTRGIHVLELAAVKDDGGAVLESGRSTPLRLNVTGTLTSAVIEPRARPSSAQGAAAADTLAWPAGIRLVVDGLDRPTDIAGLKDGRVFIAERSGRVRIVEQGRLLEDPAVVMNPSAESTALLALAIDPQFETTRYVFTLGTARSRTGGLMFEISRFREAGNTFGDRIIILDGIPASADAHASLRFGPDGRLFAAFDAAADPAIGADPASYNAKLLRLNADGTTPKDQPRSSPVVSSGHLSPRGLDWNSRDHRLWDADMLRVGPVRWVPQPTAIAIADDDLYVGTETGLMRVPLGPQSVTGLGPRALVLPDVPIRAIVRAPSGIVYFATPNALGAVQR